MFKFTSVVLVIVFMMVFGYSNLVVAEAKPPLSEVRIAGELLAGGVGGILGGVGGCLISIIGAEEDSEYSGLHTAFYLAPTGYTLGNAIGVYLVGNIGNETGSFLATLGGSILGLGVGIVVCVLSDDFFSDQEPAAFSTLVASPSICATIGFNLTRRYNSQPTIRTAPIRLDLVKVRF